MDQKKIFESTGYFVFFFSLIFSWIFFYFESGMLIDTFFAAVMSAALVWITYILFRIVWLAIKR